MEFIHNSSLRRFWCKRYYIKSIGEYSGGPNEQQTYVYAKTIIDLMCRHPHDDGKVLIIGGGIANFTNVADTFKVKYS